MPEPPETVFSGVEAKDAGLAADTFRNSAALVVPIVFPDFAVDVFAPLAAPLTEDVLLTIVGAFGAADCGCTAVPPRGGASPEVVCFEA